MPYPTNETLRPTQHTHQNTRYLGPVPGDSAIPRTGCANQIREAVHLSMTEQLGVKLDEGGRKRGINPPGLVHVRVLPTHLTGLVDWTVRALGRL